MTSLFVFQNVCVTVVVLERCRNASIRVGTQPVGSRYGMMFYSTPAQFNLDTIL